MTVYAVFKTQWNPDSNYDETVLIDIYSNEQTAMQECISYNSCHDNGCVLNSFKDSKYKSCKSIELPIEELELRYEKTLEDKI